MKRSLTILALGVVLALSGAYVLGDTKPPKPNPDLDLPDYSAWGHVKTMILHEGHPLHEAFGGLHHVYANEKALASTESLKAYSEGSMLVFELHEAVTKDNATTVGPKKVTALMLKKPGKYESTGGWGFQAWGADGKALVTDGGQQCFACHKTGAASTDFAFSRRDPR